MKNHFFHNSIYRVLAPIFLGLVVYLIILLLNNNVSQVSSLFTSQEVYICILLSLLFTESFRLVLVLSHYLSRSMNVGPLVIQLVLSSISTVVIISGGLWLYFTNVIGYPPSSIEYQVFSGAFLFLNLLMNLIHFSLHYVNKENTIRIDSEQQKNKNVEVELQDYKRDINPVLMYQSLEKLIVLVHEDTDRAEELVDDLSAVYRYILSHKQVELVNADTEMRAVDDLLRLLNEVHGGKIKLTFEELDLENLQVVPGTIVGIIEQIVRDTIITSTTPLVIDLQRGLDGYLEISHKLRDRLVKESSEEKKLIDTIQRSYNYFSDKPVVRVRAFEEGFYKIPALTLEDEALAV